VKVTVGTAAAAVAGASMIAFPLARQGGATRRLLTPLTVVGLATTTTASGVRRWGRGRAAAGVGAVMAATWAVERVGTAKGLPFGSYRYTGGLRPAVGGVPVVVPAAWWAMALPAREVAHGTLGRRSTPPRRIAVGAVALSAWDLFLDPQMTAEGFWRWARRGMYRGIPASNFAGWLVVATGVMSLLELVLPPRRADPALVAEYAAMGLMETVGFAAFFRDPVVAVAGAIGMLPMAAVALARVCRA
jgi:putative membrane protein